MRVNFHELNANARKIAKGKKVYGGGETIWVSYLSPSERDPLDEKAESPKSPQQSIATLLPLNSALLGAI